MDRLCADCTIPLPSRMLLPYGYMSLWDYGSGSIDLLTGPKLQLNVGS
jgi:hypothetical protein